MDGRDHVILRILESDARTPYVEIARRLGISESSVRKRVRKLESQGVIKRYTIDVDPEKLGYKAVALIGVDTEPSKCMDVARKLAEFDEVRKVFTATGKHMLIIEVWARDTTQLTKLIYTKYSKIDGVSRIVPAIVLKRVK
ncbi:MAG: transcriptional regulator [Thermoproteota archaeon]|nr:MAG: transcriptional regulator [Candidatus Korarchaeota archaeon]RLG54373.1 MAG: transcriptional regulator [Candidatus Korarchaeota archaeon]